MSPRGAGTARFSSFRHAPSAANAVLVFYAETAGSNEEDCHHGSARSSDGAESTNHLAEALKNDITLVTLFLVGNSIGAEGARHLAGALKVNHKLAWPGCTVIKHVDTLVAGTHVRE